MREEWLISYTFVKVLGRSSPTSVCIVHQKQRNARCKSTREVINYKLSKKKLIIFQRILVVASKKTSTLYSLSFLFARYRLSDNGVIRMQMRWINGSIGDTSRGRRVIGQGRHPPAGKDSRRFFCRDRSHGRGNPISRHVHYFTLKLDLWRQSVYPVNWRIFLSRRCLDHCRSLQIHPFALCISIIRNMCEKNL